MGSIVRLLFDCTGIASLMSRAELASSMHEIEIEKDKIKSDPAKLSVLFKEMIQMCLWYVSSHRPGTVKLNGVQGKRDGSVALDPHDRGRHWQIAERRPRGTRVAQAVHSS